LFFQYSEGAYSALREACTLDRVDIVKAFHEDARGRAYFEGGTHNELLPVAAGALGSSDVFRYLMQLPATDPPMANERTMGVAITRYACDAVIILLEDGRVRSRGYFMVEDLIVHCGLESPKLVQPWLDALDRRHREHPRHLPQHLHWCNVMFGIYGRTT